MPREAPSGPETISVRRFSFGRFSQQAQSGKRNGNHMVAILRLMALLCATRWLPFEEASLVAQDRIEKQIELMAPVGRVWRALTDHNEFGEWFRVALEGPFAVGKTVRGQILYPGFEHVVWEARIEAMEPERLFAFSWPVLESVDKNSYSPDYTGLPRTRVEFRLEPTADGTLLTVAESGFEELPADLRGVVFPRNEGGWTQQMKNIESYVAARV
jgi:uncharacterized protein YndB with AHSA1/START domain